MTSTTKKVGPIRAGVVGPFLIISVVIGLYFTFLFDQNLRWAFEYVGTQVNGAEVDIGRIKTSFIHASFLAENIEVTNPKEPARNTFVIKKIEFKLLWDALLRAKFVMDLAQMTGIEADTERKTPGRVLPPGKPGEQGYLKKLVLEKAKEQFDKTGLSNLASVLKGFDPSKQLKQLTNLQSLKRIEELSTQLSVKQKEWTKSLTALPSDQQMNQLKGRISSIHVGGNPQQAQKGIQDAAGALKDAQSQVSSVTSRTASIQSDVASFQRSVSEVDSLIEADKRAQEKMMKLPDVSSKSLSGQLFGDDLMNKVQEAEKYKKMADQYMASRPKKEKEPERKRGEGRTYAFGRPNSYPAFWLKKMSIESRATEGPNMGDVSGELLNLTTDQRAIGKPATLEVRGNFPARQIQGVQILAKLDHLQEPGKDSILLSIATYPVANRMLTQSDSFKLGLKSALGKSNLSFTLFGEEVHVLSKNEFRNSTYDVSSNQELLNSLLIQATSNLPVLTIDAEAKGHWDSLAWSVDSNLGAALANALKGQLNEKLAAARKQIETMIHDQVGSKKAMLTQNVNSVTSSITSQINAKKQQAEQTQAMAQHKLDEAKQKAAAAAAPAKKAVNQVKKKFGF
ncbi:MAG: TIGR03545 family protein [Bacteriovoracia bacterium]